MSKRKSILVANTTEDFAFEDQEMDSESPPAATHRKKSKSNAQISTPVSTTTNASSSSRVSGRTKKVKSIYDPSENLKPIGKRRRDGQEEEKKRSSSVSEVSKPFVSSPIKVRPQEPAIEDTFDEPETNKISIKPKSEKLSRISARGSIQPAKTVAQSNGKAIEKVRRSILSSSPTTAAASAKEPSKRILDKKKRNSSVTETTTILTEKKPILTEITAKTSSRDFMTEPVPEVIEWSGQNVSDYFQSKLGFSKKDSSLFKDEEIDGEALMIMKRSDIVNSKFAHIKLGTAIKFWSHILRLQTKSNDPSQAWV